MSKILKLSTLLAIFMACLGCSSDGDTTPAAGDVVITCSPTEIAAPVEGGSYTVNVTCSGREWTAFTDSESSWVHISVNGSTASSGTVAITIDANSLAKERVATVVVRSGTSARQTIVIRQAAATPEPPDPSIPTPEGYTLVWHDEFDSGESPRTGADGWWYELGKGQNGWGNHELQSYVDGTADRQSCFIDNGILNIVLRKSGSNYYSIRMNTSRSWQYGWFEARLRLPKGRGTWPAFWMMPKNFRTWPGDGEIDIMEEVGYNPNYVLSTIHCNRYNNSGTSIESAGRSVPTAQTEFHVYACEWTAQYLRFFVDGTPILTYHNDGSGYDSWPFTTLFYLKLNLAWGGDWGGAQGIDESCLPAVYQVDYVRVFQK